MTFKSIWVTGSQGFLGYELCKILSNKNVNVYRGSRQSCNLLEIAEVSLLLERCRPELIIHCAATRPRKKEDYMDNRIAGENLILARTIVEASNIPIVFISSMAVYGDKAGSYSEKSVCNPSTSYGKSKFQTEKMLMKAKNPTLVLRIPGLFSEGRRQGLVFNAVVNGLQGSLLEVEEDGSNWSGIHITDAAHAIIDLVDAWGGSSTTTINIGYPGIWNKAELVKAAYCLPECYESKSTISSGFELELGRLRSYLPHYEACMHSGLMRMYRGITS